MGAKWSIRPELIPVSAAWEATKNICTPPFDKMLVHCRVTPQH